MVDYDVCAGILRVEHAFPHNVLPTPQALVDVRLVLELMKAQYLQRGSWLNIIGYVQKHDQRQKKTTTLTKQDAQIASTPTVQAIVIWDAGAIRIADYEAALTIQRQKRVVTETAAVY